MKYSFGTPIFNPAHRLVIKFDLRNSLVYRGRVLFIVSRHDGKDCRHIFSGAAKRADRIQR